MENYNKIIKYRTLDTGIYKILTEGIYFDKDFLIFKEEINENFIKNYTSIIEDISNKEDEQLTCTIYSLSAKTNYNKLKHQLERIYINIK